MALTISAALPFSANSPLGRRWMNSMMATRTKTLAEHRAGPGFEHLVDDAEVEGADQRTGQEPTPPNTTTMKLSMM